MSTTDTLLLEIFERLGSIDAKLESGSQTHQDLKSRLEKLDNNVEDVDKKTAAIANAVADVEKTTAAMKPIVADYESNKNKAAGILLAITTIAGAVGFFASEIKAFLLRGR